MGGGPDETVVVVLTDFFTLFHFDIQDGKKE